MRTNSLALIFSALLAASTVVAHADTYTFTISTGSTATTPATTFGVSGSLTGTPDPMVPGAIVLSDISGSGQGYEFTGVVPLGANTNFTYDNLLFTNPSAIHVDQEGVLLYLNSMAGTSLGHVYYTSGYHVDVIDPNDPSDITPFSIDTFVINAPVTAIPEPSTYVLLATGLAGLLMSIGTLRRRSSFMI
jgi:hypothetical protein